MKKFFKTNLKDSIKNIFSSAKDKEESIEEIEEALILADISFDIVERIVKSLRKSQSIFKKENVIDVLKKELIGILDINKNEINLNEKTVFLIVGVNGSGKTTTAAKIANYYKNQGKRVLLSAADTFRAAGSEQLKLWGERLGINVIGGDKGADSGSVVYNSMASFMSKDYDLLIIDTAGRVQTKENLMKELDKIVKIIKKFDESQPKESFLVVDATMGKNTLEQARKFKEFSGLTGLILTKTDGTAKGGTVINIIDELRVPIRYIGTGESENDLEIFSLNEFVNYLIE